MDQLFRDPDSVPRPCSSVLVVEDDPLLRSAIASTMREHGFHVVEAASADEAISVLQMPGAGVGLVFADAEMAGMRDGFDLLDWVRAVCPDLPVVLISASTLVASPSGEEHDARSAATPKPYHGDPILRSMVHSLGQRDTMAHDGKPAGKSQALDCRLHEGRHRGDQ